MTDAGWQLVADDLLCRTLEHQWQAASLAASLRNDEQWLDALCGRDCVYVRFNLARMSADEALALLQATPLPAAEAPERPEPIRIPVCYHPEVAPDLLETCSVLGLTMDEFIHRHTKTDHEVAMLGFMPGFAYIDGLDPSLHIERLARPRQRVAAGSVGIAGGQTGIYPFDGPGGWRLIAHTRLTLFDPAAMPPATLRPMQRVRFVPITLEELEGEP